MHVVAAEQHPAASSELLLGDSRNKGLSEWPGIRHRAPGFCDSDDLRGERDRVTDQPLRVSGAVPSLVMRQDARYRGCQEMEGSENARAHLRMSVHDGPLFRAQYLRLV